MSLPMLMLAVNSERERERSESEKHTCNQSQRTTKANDGRKRVNGSGLDLKYVIECFGVRAFCIFDIAQSSRLFSSRANVNICVSVARVTKLARSSKPTRQIDICNCCHLFVYLNSFGRIWGLSSLLHRIGHTIVVIQLQLNYKVNKSDGLF